MNYLTFDFTPFQLINRYRARYQAHYPPSRKRTHTYSSSNVHSWRFSSKYFSFDVTPFELIDSERGTERAIQHIHTEVVRSCNVFFSRFSWIHLWLHTISTCSPWARYRARYLPSALSTIVYLFELSKDTYSLSVLVICHETIISKIQSMTDRLTKDTSDIQRFLCKFFCHLPPTQVNKRFSFTHYYDNYSQLFTTTTHVQMLIPIASWYWSLVLPSQPVAPNEKMVALICVQWHDRPVDNAIDLDQAARPVSRHGSFHPRAAAMWKPQS